MKRLLYWLTGDGYGPIAAREVIVLSIAIWVCMGVGFGLRALIDGTGLEDSWMVSIGTFVLGYITARQTIQALRPRVLRWLHHRVENKPQEAHQPWWDKL